MKSFTPSETLCAVWYVVNILIFYLWIVPWIGGDIKSACVGWRPCSKFMYRTGWNYNIDLSDHQWREFRNGLPLLFVVGLITSLLSTLVRSISNDYFAFLAVKDIAKNSIVSETPSRILANINYTRLILLTSLRTTVGLSVLYVLHGRHSLVVVSIALGGYLVAKSFGRTSWHGMIWLYAIAILLFKESYRIKSFEGFQFLLPIFDHRYGGMYGWQLPANFLVLRMISFGYDFHWADPRHKMSRNNENESTTKDDRHAKHDQIDDSSKLRTDHHLDTLELSNDVLDRYSLFSYVSYALYAPLYMAGPIITYDSFMSCSIQSVMPNAETKKTVPPNEDVLFYFIRWLVVLCLLEALTNRFPFFAVATSRLINRLSPAQIAIVCYVLLKMMWLKFMVMWRFFRLWALADGINPPENMTRCMSNNYSLAGFWRGWHSSFNLWIVRYMYKPMGGKFTNMVTVWVVFVFVAMWHDMEVALFAWGLLNALFYVLEVGIKRVVEQTGVLGIFPELVRELLISIGGATYILILIGVNLVGYAVGVTGASLILNKILSAEGLYMLAVAFYFLSIGVLFMRLLRKKDLCKP